MIRNKIKTILTALAPVLLLFTLSCSEEFLDEPALTFYSEDNFYTSPASMELGLIPLYVECPGFSHEWVLGTDLAEITIYNGGSSDVSLSTYNEYLNPKNYGGIWNNSYSSINTANLLLSKIDQIEWESDNQKNRIKGNALFFRAWIHFTLVQYYGDVPLVLEPIKEAKTDFVRNPISEVIAQVIKDLTEAVTLLPDFGPLQGEIGKGAAQHLLANVYLYDKDWVKAEQTATSLISSGNYRLMTERFGVEKDKPGTPFTDLFIDGNINRWEGNYEMIYAYQSANYRIKGNSASRCPKVNILNRYNNQPGLTLSMEYWQRGKHYIRPTAFYVFTLFDPVNPNDDRGSEFAIKRIWRYNDADYINGQKEKGTPLKQIVNGVEVEVKVGDTVVITDQNRDILWPLSTKAMDRMGDILSETGGDKDYPISRLAETYLFRAEARFRQGNLSGAADDINMLRRRANAPEVSESEIDIDLILDERAKELLWEENRKTTLTRTGKLIERNLLYNPRSAGNISEKHNLFPIPQVEIDRMKDSPNFKQNPGY